MPLFNGTNLADIIGGTERADTIRGFGGNDVLFGEERDDLLDGGNGNDYLDGDDGNDTLLGGAGNDVLHGGEGADSLDGGDNNDVVVGGTGNDTLLGGAGNDTLNGQRGDDVLNGGEGNDVLFLLNGDDTANGGVGNDLYFVHGRAGDEVVIADTAGLDTLDFSHGRTGAVVNLTAGGVSTVDGRTIRISGGTTTLQPLDVMMLQDLSGSFSDDIATVKTLVPTLVDAIQAVQSNSLFGLASFVDKPISPFGGGSDYAYRLDQALTADEATFTAAINEMSILGGGDLPESQLEALLQLARNSDAAGYRADALKVVVLATDALWHVAGDHTVNGANNGDGVQNGTPPSTGEDYPSIAQAREALLDAGIVPIFLVTDGVLSNYQTLVRDLGFGTALELESDSANIVSAITRGLATINQAVIERAVGTRFADRMTGNAAANVLEGGAGNDRIDGGAGNDTINGGTGNDTMIGGAGADDFVFTAAPGVDQIIGFQNGLDQLNVDALGITSFAGITAATVTGGVRITGAGGLNVTLTGVTAAQIDATDFIF
jgi:Ca2+-binding RTX toxin-like protein